jgi:hypothetical protein
MRFLDTIRFTLGMFYLQIRYFFSRKKEILSHSKTQPYIEVLTLSELDNPAPLYNLRQQNNLATHRNNHQRKGIQKVAT